MDTEDSSSLDFEGFHGNDCDNSIDDISAYGDIGNFPQGQGQVNETDSYLDLNDIDLSDVDSDDFESDLDEDDMEDDQVDMNFGDNLHNIDIFHFKE